MKIIDISLTLNKNTIIYPGNPKVNIKEKKGKTSIDSEITIGSHTGTHIDAPKHVFPDGDGIDKIPLEKIIGECRVLDFADAEDSVKISDLERHDIKAEERILAKTKNSSRGFNEFYDDYVYLDGDAAEYLAQKRVTLFGIDYLSVKQRGSSDTRAHTELLKNDIVIIEGLDLSQVEAGKYFLIALPLKFIGLDGSPARAVLIKDLIA